ncbi:MAG: hypothetical protein Q9222_001146 [Ikaeria aurantiellina]
MHYEAVSIGSKTRCNTVTDLCDIEQHTKLTNVTQSTGGVDVNATELSSWGDASFLCQRDIAGLDLVGNFSDLRNSSLLTSMDRPGFRIVYCQKSTKETVVDGLDIYGPSLSYAVLLQVQADLVTNPELLPHNATSNHPGFSHDTFDRSLFGLVATTTDEGAWANGILSCNTTLSDVVGSFSICPYQMAYMKWLQTYSFRNDAYTVMTWKAMNETASYPFILLMHTLTGPGLVDLQQGVEAFISGASESLDIASGWASLYDQEILSARPAMLVQRPPLLANESTTVQVSRIPRAPVVTLIALDLAYAAIGTCLMVAALIAVRKGRGVKDAQARLSTLAVVAESFENPALGEDATNIDILFAERRGKPTRRVAVNKYHQPATARESALLV